MELAKKHEGHGFSQFELSKNVLHNLKHFDLTPTGKLVLLILVDCYNPENKSVVFPSMEFIADMAGIGLTATKQAIKDLILTGCIIKSKRGKIRGNYNKYLLTKKIECRAPGPAEIKQIKKPQNELLKSTKTDCFKKAVSGCFHDEQIKEQKNNIVNISKNKKNESKTDIQILQQYAKEHKATNIQGYINALKLNGSAAEIIKKYREKEQVEQYWNRQAAQTSEMIKQMREQKGSPMPDSFRALKAKLMGMKN